MPLSKHKCKVKRKNMLRTSGTCSVFPRHWRRCLHAFVIVTLHVLSLETDDGFLNDCDLKHCAIHQRTVITLCKRPLCYLQHGCLLASLWGGKGREGPVYSSALGIKSNGFKRDSSGYDFRSHH